ncbi:MIT domain-containing protein 1-like [Musca vetustissima]|uniref:MIT domain-containing protein 1-like n=1 Tax=Musca vetustissima TaxID=27455 RepID=UPI002AB610C1|nr:MIT domain-containing protein 1-like [Musca vetustissima]
MNPKDVLMKAVHCERDKRLLQSQHYYQLGLELLREFLHIERNSKIAKRYYEHIGQYIQRSKKVDRQIAQLLKTGEFLESIRIHENSEGHSYETMIGKYFDGEVNEIYLEEPYFQQLYQLENFIIFLEMAVKKCPRLKFIKLVTNRVRYDSYFRDLQTNLRERGIELVVDRDQHLHDRKVALNTGIVIKIGRGLHIFKAANSPFSLGIMDYDFRRCLKTDVDIWRSAAKA